MKITDDVIYIGVNDHDIDLFEGQYVVKNGMAYNSYLIKDKKTAVLDSVDYRFADEWLNNIQIANDGKEPDYIIIQHMEPDHSASLKKFTETYKNTIVVSNSKAFVMMKNYFGTDFLERRIIVSDGENFSLGKHNLCFVFAPMVHWPEVMLTYDSYEKVLFSADAFGKFGALDVEEDWACEARRYYIGIVGKYGVQVQTLLKKASGLDIQKICPLHGPVLTENLDYYINLYDIWSSYSVESEGVLIAYTSVYGHTKKAVELLEQALKQRNCPKVSVVDLAREDMAEAVEDAFRYGKIVLATTTYNGDVFPFMRTFIENLKERNFQNRTVGIIENGSWASTAGKVMRTMLENCKNLTFTENNVKILSAVNEQNIKEINALADELI